MSSILLSFGKGLGDHVRLSGIVRAYAERYDSVGLFCIESYMEAVTFLYRDLPNVHLVKANSQSDRDSVKETRIFAVAPHEESGILGERACYAMAEVPIEQRWSKFKLVRDLAREELCTKALVPAGPYQFVHDDDRFTIDPSKLNPNLPIVRPSKDFMFFDYVAVIAGAEEVHAIESSFMFLVDHLEYDGPKQKLFAHRYARPLRPVALPLVKKPWHILL